MNSLRHLNKKVLYLGMTGLQLAVILMLILWTAVVSLFAGMAVAVFASLFVALVKRELQKGSPDPIQGWIIKARSPKNLDDENNALRYL